MNILEQLFVDRMAGLREKAAFTEQRLIAVRGEVGEELKALCERVADSLDSVESVIAFFLRTLEWEELRNSTPPGPPDMRYHIGFLRSDGSSELRSDVVEKVAGILGMEYSHLRHNEIFHYITRHQHKDPRVWDALAEALFSPEPISTRERAAWKRHVVAHIGRRPRVSHRPTHTGGRFEVQS